MADKKQSELFAPVAGLPVQWFPHPGDAPHAAVLTGVGEQCVALIVLDPGYANGMARDGVFHRDDPTARRHLEVNPEAGVWDYHPWHKALAGRLERLEKSLAGLVTALGLDEPKKGGSHAA